MYIYICIYMYVFSHVRSIMGTSDCFMMFGFIGFMFGEKNCQQPQQTTRIRGVYFHQRVTKG